MVMWPLLFRPEPRFLLSVSRSNGPPRCRSGLTTLTSPRRPGDVGLTLTSAMVSRFLSEVDFVARLQAHVRFLPAASPTRIRAEALGLAVDVDDLDALDLDLLVLPHELHGGLDVLLGGIGPDAEDDLVVPIGNVGGLFRDDRGEQYRHETLFVHSGRRGFRGRLRRAHPRISSNCVNAARVSNTFSNRTRLTGSTSLVSRTSTLGRLREERNMFSSTLSVTTSTVPERPSDLIFSAKSLFFGVASAIRSITDSRP